MSRKTFNKWRNVAAEYGIEALRPRPNDGRRCQTPTPTHVIDALLTLAITEPTLGYRQSSDHGFTLGKSAIQNHLLANGLGRQHKRLARAAAGRGAPNDTITDAACNDEPFAFSHCFGLPGIATRLSRQASIR